MDKIIEVPITTTVIKEFNGKDLPLYCKWDVEHTTWLYRVRIKNGRTVCDLLQSAADGIEFRYVTLSSAFADDNTPATADDWRNLMHNFIQQMQ
jgi:hypothetical protein